MACNMFTTNMYTLTELASSLEPRLCLASLALLFSCSEAITRGGGGGVAYGALRGGLAEVASLRAAHDGGSCVPSLGEVADGG